MKERFILEILQLGANKRKKIKEKVVELQVAKVWRE